MILPLLATIIIEGLIVFGYARRFNKPVISLLLTSVIANLFTQPLLWIGLNIFFDEYLTVLLIAELLIWLIESVLLFVWRLNRLGIREAFLLSLAMNLVSFGVGWALPI